VERIACTHKGTYADDCLCERVRQHKCYIVATCDKDLRRRIRKVRRGRGRRRCSCECHATGLGVGCAVLFLQTPLLRWPIEETLLGSAQRSIASCALCQPTCGGRFVAMIITLLARGWMAMLPPTVIANGEQSLSHEVLGAGCLACGACCAMTSVPACCAVDLGVMLSPHVLESGSLTSFLPTLLLPCFAMQIPGVPIMYISQHRYSIERLPEATIGGAPRT
jgi:hypothetical protein